MDYVVILLLQIGSAIASLVLMSIGLAVIFGMMRVINLAHGEFLMLGGYAAITAFNLGVNLWVAMVVVAPLTVGLFGAIVERLVIRHLYGRLIDTMLATWGLSLAMIGFVTVVFGNTVSGISAPLGSVSIGAYRTGRLRDLPDRGRGDPADRGLAGAALHPRRPDRARHHAECRRWRRRWAPIRRRSMP